MLDCFVYIYNDIFEGKSFDDMTLDELNEREDDIDEEEERIFEAYRFVYISSTQEAYRFVYISRTQEAYRFVYRTQLTGLFIFQGLRGLRLWCLTPLSTIFQL